MNMKYHIIAFPAILLVLFAVYMLASPAPEQAKAAQEQNTRFIQVSRATWGENCNPALTANGKPNVEPNNVLLGVSQRCDGRLQCQAFASEAFLGTNPLPKGFSCSKDLVILYRCETFKKPKTVMIKEGESALLDCTKQDEEPAPESNEAAPLQDKPTPAATPAPSGAAKAPLPEED